MDQAIAKALPKLPQPFQLHHVRTVAKKCRRLVYIPKKSAKTTPLDTQTVHFFTLTYENLALYAMELYVFESPLLVTVFVSKADTTGHFPIEENNAPSYALLSTELIRIILHDYINTSKPVRLCLFAKSASRYLFPGSELNTKKHVLKDTSLVKWWARVLDPLANEFLTIDKVRMAIPGSDDNSVKACFPQSALMQWSVGDIFDADPDLPAVKCIPRFPDDPKSRFLDFLVAEKRALKTSRNQFWLELPSRQEFRLGSVVGIIGLEGRIKPNSTSIDLTPAVKYSQFIDVYECIMSQDFSTRSKAETSTATLIEQLGDESLYEIVGELPPREKKKKQLEPVVNTLNVGLIRKKKKN